MERKGAQFKLGKDDIFTSVVPPEVVHGPAKGNLTVENGVLFATIGEQKYELLAASIEAFDNLVYMDPEAYLKTPKAREEDAGQDDLPWAKKE